MILRELLYVDVDKVRGLAAQLEEGVPESQTLSRRDNSELGLGAKSLIGFSKSSGGEEKTEKSLGDYMFPLLEDWLESIGLLRDISEELRFQDSWSNIEEIAPLGRIIRVSAPAGLFHPRLVAQALSGFAIAAHGLRDMGILPEGAASSVKPPKAKTPSERRADRAGKEHHTSGTPEALEDLIPQGKLPLDIDRDYLAGIVKVARGIFLPGLHFNMACAGAEGPMVTARLEEGRRFLDSDADVLFSRYGVTYQDWTLVGTVGSHGVKTESTDYGTVVDDDGTVSRARTASVINQLLQFLGSQGFLDLPKYPGFSVVPLAVYRVLAGSDQDLNARQT